MIRVVALCGSQSADSSTERLLRVAAAHAEFLGARVVFYRGEQLRLPLYVPRSREQDAAARELLAAVAAADGLLLGSPSHHGSLSGLLKNALDYLEELRDDPSPYLHDKAVGCVAVGAGSQGPVNTLRALRDIVHSLRGWPTPLGVAVDVSRALGPGTANPAVERQLALVGRQVVEFASARRAAQACLVVPRPA
ncbi:NAD(P)H-dependent oxidoreductase [Sphaerisporangium sp. B11E5]|uniref:NADPH-dependent FMN reductase n=1 Tax=Sphaerisporangium sp. B11E5 TaxID=3153563 RepID=UPI00325EB35A